MSRVSGSRTIIFFLAFVIARAALALDPATALSQYRVAQWTRAQGLPGVSVYAIDQTPDGYLWIGTEDGLARFDGSHFTLYNKRNTPEFTKNYVRTLCTDRDGVLWIGTLDGVLRMSGGKFRRIETDHADHGNVLSLLCTKEGQVYAGMGRGGLFAIEHDSARPLASWQGKSALAVSALAQAPDGRVLVGTFGDGLFACDRTECASMVNAAELPSKKITSLWSDADGMTWLGTADGGMAIVIDGRAEKPAFATQLPKGIIWNLRRDNDGNLWISIGENGGLARLAGKSLQVLPKADDKPPDSFILFEDVEGNLWTGSTSAGLYRLSDVKLRTFGAAEGLSQDLVWSVMEDAAGALWVGTSGSGVDRLGPAGTRNWKALTNRLANIVTSLAQTADGQIWLGTRDGVYTIDDDGNEHPDKRAGAPSSFVPALFTDSQGRLWAGSFGKSPAVLERGEWRSIDARQGYRALNAWAFAEDRAGAIWVATSTDGIYRYFEGTWTNIGVAEGLTYASTMAVFVDSLGGLWALVQDGGIHRIIDGRAIALGSRAGLPTESVYSMLEDDQGNFWFGTGIGIYRVARAELDAVVAGTLGRAQATAFGTSEGMRDTGCNGTAQPVAWKRQDGTLWFATNAGVVRIDPTSLPKNTRPPNLLIEEMRADGVLLDTATDAALPADTKRIVFRFAALSLTAPERMRFRYKLLGLDDHWVEFDGRREVEFMGLRPGSYQFLVTASNNDGVWATSPAGAAFSIARPFVGSPAFYALGGGLLLLLGFAYHRSRLATLRARDAVLQERSRIARELHDTIAQGFSSMLVQLEVGVRLTATEDSETRERLRRIQQIARENMDALRQSVTLMRTDEPIGQSLAKALREQLEHQLEGTAHEFSFVCRGEPRSIQPLAAHHLCRAAQQAVSNTLLHAGASRVDVHLEFGAHEVVVRVRDNGRGIPATAAHRSAGMGLEGMRTRVEEAGGRLEIFNANEGGTLVTIVMPYASSPDDS